MNLDLTLDPDERQQLSDIASIVVTALAFVFVILLVIEFAAPLTPAESRWVSLAGWIIWLIFAVDFVVRLANADAKRAYLRKNWLAAISVLLPAVRVFRVFQAIQALRALRLLRAVSGTNRGAKALKRVSVFAGAGYIAALTVMVIVISGAGMAWLERDQPHAAIRSFGDGLWWAATTVIQQGSQHQPSTLAGRVLAVMVMAYSLGVAGYVAAWLATLLLGRSQEQTKNDTTILREEIAALRHELERIQAIPPATTTGAARAAGPRMRDHGSASPSA